MPKPGLLGRYLVELLAPDAVLKLELYLLVQQWMELRIYLRKQLLNQTLPAARKRVLAKPTYLV